MKLSTANQNVLLDARAAIVAQDIKRAKNLRRSVGNRRHLVPGTGPRIAR